MSKNFFGACLNLNLSPYHYKYGFKGIAPCLLKGLLQHSAVSNVRVLFLDVSANIALKTVDSSFGTLPNGTKNMKTSVRGKCFRVNDVTKSCRSFKELQCVQWYHRLKCIILRGKWKHKIVSKIWECHSLGSMSKLSIFHDLVWIIYCVGLQEKMLTRQTQCGPNPSRFIISESGVPLWM